MKEIQTNNTTILLVEVPEDAIWFQIMPRQGIVNEHLRYNFGPLRFGRKYEQLPSSQYQILGKSSELSEEQMKEICDTDGKGYMYHLEHPKNSYCKSVQESYLSLLEANGIVDRNPYGDKPKRYIAFFHPGFMTDNDFERLEEYDIQLSKWQESQSKVKHYLVLKRI